MSESVSANNFYFKMAILLMALIIAGFGSATLVSGKSPLELPTLFHLHGISYLIWYALFIVQTSLINKQNYGLHKQLGYSSIIIVIAMLITSFLMAANSFERGTSPIPNITIQNFLIFPLLDLVGIVIFFSIGVINRKQPLIHKHAMLIMSIAIMDPAIARLALVLGFPPLALLLHILLVSLVIFYDRKSAGKVHFVTWFGLIYVLLRMILIFTVGGTETWANFVNSLFS